MLLVEMEARVPATNSKESPGKKGVITSPVSQKIRKKELRKSKGRTEQLMQVIEYLCEVQSQ
jgi:hypothetical protein